MPRKLLIVFAALLLTSLIIVFATPLGLPSEDDFDVVCKGETELCAATNNAIESYVYEIVDGKINRIYKWFNLEDRRINPIVALAQSENNIYAVCEYSNEWQIRSMVRTDPVPFAILGRKEGETVLNYTVNQGVGHITVRTADGGIKVLENNKDTPNDWKTKLVAKAPSAGEVVEAHYVGEILNLKYSDGQAVSVTSSGVSALTDQTVFEKPALDTLKFSLSARLACKQTILLIIVIGLGIVFIPILLAMSVINKTKRIQTRLSAAFIALFFVAGCVFCGVVCLDAILGASVAALPLMLLKVAIALIVFSGIGAIVVILLMRHSTEPMKDLTKRMSLIADGDFTVQDVPQREDELGEMYRNLQQMCLSLSIRDYEVNSIMQAYHRFVPRGLENLLDRASIMEVSIGDSRAINGNVGLITVCNRQRVRQELKDDNYSDFVSRSSVLMSSAVRVHEGLLLSSGFDMSASKFYFGKERSDGVKAGLDLLGESGRVQESILKPRPDFFVLLHNTVFLYGIAGSQDSMFPFLSSSELEFLGSYADQLRAAGARLVLTEQFMDQMTSENTTRYIGFVSDNDLQKSFKLYEVLDAYPSLERNIRINYDKQLQEAITMFYKSDFYLARNSLSALLRTCPTDGIVRWYLFACEYFFHNSGDQDMNFQLFGKSFA